MIILMSKILQLSTFFNFIKESKIPISVAYKLHRLKKEVDLNLSFYQENLQKITFEYAEKDKDGNFINSDNGDFLISAENQLKFYQKINELLDLEIEILDISFELREFDNLNIPFEILEPILDFIKE